MTQQRTIIPNRTEHSGKLTTMYAAFSTSWKRVYRQVFWLANGDRTIEKISRLLHKPTEKVEQIIYELLVSGHIKVKAGEKELAMNPALLKESFGLVTPHKEEFARHFYTLLFTQYPQTRALFAATEEGMRRQESALIATLAVVIAGVERGENLTEIIHALGSRHSRYGAQAAHYPIVGGLLIQTFQDKLGPAFTPDMKTAWSQAYEIISTEMLKGADQPSQKAETSLSRT